MIGRRKIRARRAPWSPARAFDDENGEIDQSLTTRPVRTSRCASASEARTRKSKSLFDL